MSEIMTAFPNRLPRFGLRWNGPREFVPTPMDDGYWTPYHLAAAEIARLEAREDGYKAHIAKQAAEIADLHKLLQDGWVEVADGPVSRRALKERDAARAEAEALRKEAARMRGALEMLYPGLVLDLRYADADDDRDALQLRIDTVEEALSPSTIDAAIAKEQKP